MLGVLWDPARAKRAGWIPVARALRVLKGLCGPARFMCVVSAGNRHVETLRELAGPSDPGGRLWQDQVRGQEPAGEGPA